MDAREKEPNPFIGVAVRFFFGAVAGALLGLGWFAYSGGLGLSVVFWLAVPALLCGLLAAWLGDTFWENLIWWW